MSRGIVILAVASGHKIIGGSFITVLLNLIFLEVSHKKGRSKSQVLLFEAQTTRTHGSL